MNTESIILILLAHYVGDWVAQPFLGKWMGNKHKSNWHLSNHAFVLMIPLIIVGVILWGPIGIAWAVFNAGTHYFIDFASSRLTHKFFDENKISWFWFTIGTDQTLHLLILFSSAAFF